MVLVSLFWECKPRDPYLGNRPLTADCPLSIHDKLELGPEQLVRTGLRTVGCMHAAKSIAQNHVWSKMCTLWCVFAFDFAGSGSGEDLVLLYRHVHSAVEELSVALQPIVVFPCGPRTHERHILVLDAVYAMSILEHEPGYGSIERTDALCSGIQK